MFFYTPDCHNNQASFITLEPNVRQNEIVLPHPVHRTKQTHAQIQKGPQLHIEYLITLQMKLGVTYHMSQCDLTLNLSSKIYVSHDTTIIINHLNLPLIIGPRFLQPFQQPRPCGNFNLAASVRSNKEKSPKQEDKEDCLIKWIASIKLAVSHPRLKVTLYTINTISNMELFGTTCSQGLLCFFGDLGENSHFGP